MTNIGAGLGAQLMYAEESAWGTRATPTKTIEFNSETLATAIDRVESAGLRAGQRYLRANRWKPGKRSVSGTTTHEVASSGFGLLLKHCVGAVATSQPASVTDPTVYEHKLTPGSLAGKGMTVQIGKPDNTGTVNPFDYVGGKVMSWKISVSTDGLLMLEVTWDFQDEQTNQTLATASYAAADELLVWTGAAITFGGVSVPCRDITITGNNARKSDRFFLGAATKSEQLANAVADVQIEATPEFSSMTLYNHYKNADQVAFTANFEGSIISHTYANALEFTAASVRMDGDTPNVSGPDILTQPLKLKATDDGTDPVAQLVYRTTDTTP